MKHSRINFTEVNFPKQIYQHYFSRHNFLIANPELIFQKLILQKTNPELIFQKLSFQRKSHIQGFREILFQNEYPRIKFPDNLEETSPELMCQEIISQNSFPRANSPELVSQELIFQKQEGNTSRINFPELISQK